MDGLKDVHVHPAIRPSDNPSIDHPAIRPSDNPPIDHPAIRPSDNPSIDHPAIRPSDNPPVHRCSTADNDRTFSTIFGSTAASASTSAASLVRPKENRSAATARSCGTAIAVSTCDGSTDPVLHAEPAEQAMPARSRCISIASESV